MVYWRTNSSRLLFNCQYFILVNWYVTVWSRQRVSVDSIKSSSGQTKTIRSCISVHVVDSSYAEDKTRSFWIDFSHYLLHFPMGFDPISYRNPNLQHWFMSSKEIHDTPILFSDRCHLINDFVHSHIPYLFVVFHLFLFVFFNI